MNKVLERHYKRVCCELRDVATRDLYEKHGRYSIGVLIDDSDVVRLEKNTMLEFVNKIVSIGCENIGTDILTIVYFDGLTYELCIVFSGEEVKEFPFSPVELSYVSLSDVLDEFLTRSSSHYDRQGKLKVWSNRK